MGEESDGESIILKIDEKRTIHFLLCFFLKYLQEIMVMVSSVPAFIFVFKKYDCGLLQIPTASISIMIQSGEK